MNVDPDGDFWFIPVLVATAPTWMPWVVGTALALGTAITLDAAGLNPIKYAKAKEGKLRGRDAKRREKKQIDDALGKNRASREKESKDLHKGKKMKRNDDNYNWNDLKSRDFH